MKMSEFVQILVLSMNTTSYFVIFVWSLLTDLGPICFEINRFGEAYLEIMISSLIVILGWYFFFKKIQEGD